MKNSFTETSNKMGPHLFNTTPYSQVWEMILFYITTNVCQSNKLAFIFTYNFQTVASLLT